MARPQRGPAGAMLPMGFNPSLPLDGSLLEAGEMRSQFNGLKTLIDNVPAGPPGPEGAQGDPGPQGPQGDYGPHGPAGPMGTQGEQGPQGPEGPQGPPFATATVDGVNTLNPGESATVSTSFSGNVVHFTFGIPRGADGANGTNGTDGAPGEQGPQGVQGIAGPQSPAGPQGPAGGVTVQQLNDAMATTALNPNGIGPFGGGFSDPPTQAELVALPGYVESLRAALVR